MRYDTLLGTLNVKYLTENRQIVYSNTVYTTSL